MNEPQKYTPQRGDRVQRHVDRYGKVRFYYAHPNHARIPLPDPSSPDFRAALERAKTAVAAKLKAPSIVIERARPQTLRWLCEQYFASAAFTDLDPGTQRSRRLVIEHCLEEPISPGARERFADCPIQAITPKAIKVLRDRKAKAPAAANKRVKAFRQIFAWAIEEEVEGVEFNPARDVKYKESRGSGYHSWTIEEVERYEARHPVGTRARLAMALLLYTGQRRSDVVRFGRQHVRNGWLRFTQFKGRKRKPVTLEIPIIPELQRIIDASPTGDLTFLVTSFGNPFTTAGFGNKMREWCDQAGLPHCSAHGLRKAAAARLAEIGCTDAEIMSITGHTTRKEIDRYTRGVRQRKMAERVLRRFQVVKGPGTTAEQGGRPRDVLR